MNINHPDIIWKRLLDRSAPTFAAESDVPYGFVTKMLTTLRTDSHQQQDVERIGLRALYASLAALGLAAAVTLSVSLQQSNNDFDPGVRSLVQVENLPYS